MKQLSDKAVTLIGQAFHGQIDGLRLIPVYGPSDRGGITEWMSKVDLPAQIGIDPPPGLNVFISVAAWADDDGDEFAATIESTGAIRTSRWVARWESDTYPVNVAVGDIDGVVRMAVRYPLVSSGMGQALAHAINLEGYRPKGAIDLL